MCQLFYFHYSVIGHLGWFHRLAIVKNVGIHMDKVPLGYADVESSR